MNLAGYHKLQVSPRIEATCGTILFPIFEIRLNPVPSNILNAAFPQLSYQNCMVNSIKCFFQVEEYY